MSTVMEPRTEPVRIEIFESPEVAVLDRMIQAVRDDKWCINIQDDGQGRNCALGMISRYAIGNGTFRGGYGDPGLRAVFPGFGLGPNPDYTLADRVHDLLFAAIPENERSLHNTSASIATYNNSRTADEVVEWYERAKLLA